MPSLILFSLIFFWFFFRGLPYWLREVPNITFRTDNEPFKVYNTTYFLLSLPIFEQILLSKNLVSWMIYIKKISFYHLPILNYDSEICMCYLLPVPYEEICNKDCKTDEEREALCITRRSYNLITGLIWSIFCSLFNLIYIFCSYFI